MITKEAGENWNAAIDLIQQIFRKEIDFIGSGKKAHAKYNAGVKAGIAHCIFKLEELRWNDPEDSIFGGNGDLEEDRYPDDDESL